MPLKRLGVGDTLYVSVDGAVFLKEPSVNGLVSGVPFDEKGFRYNHIDNPRSASENSASCTFYNSNRKLIDDRIRELQDAYLILGAMTGAATEQSAATP